MSKNEKKRLVPKLRFPEFRDSEGWERKSFKGLYSFYSTNTLSRDKLNYINGTIKNIHYGDIHTKFSTLFDIKNEIVPFINSSESFEKIKSSSYCEEGDLIFADASEDLEDIGKSIEIINLNNEKLLSGLHTILARQNSKVFIIGFSGYLFKSNNIRYQIKKEAQGTKVLGISMGRLSNIVIVYPTNMNEQQRIADCLTSLDDLISAQTQKVEILKKHKKGLMQQLFPKEGESIPLLRFPEFRDLGEWNCVILKNLAKKIVLKNKEKNEGRVLTNSATKGILDQRDYFDKDIANKDNLYSYYIVDLGDFVYNPRTSNAAPVGPISKNNIGKGVMSPLYTVFRFNRSINDFYEQYFKSNLWNSYLYSISNTGARHDRMSITSEEFMMMPLPCPTLSEQQKIADCLTSLDDLISAQTQKVEILKNHKKGLMQQLFPSTEENEE